MEIEVKMKTDVDVPHNLKENGRKETHINARKNDKFEHGKSTPAQKKTVLKERFHKFQVTVMLCVRSIYAK